MHPGMQGRGRTEDWLLPSFLPPLFREVTVPAGWSKLGREPSQWRFKGGRMGVDDKEMRAKAG